MYTYICSVIYIHIYIYIYVDRCAYINTQIWVRFPAAKTMGQCFWVDSKDITAMSLESWLGCGATSQIDEEIRNHGARIEETPWYGDFAILQTFKVNRLTAIYTKVVI